MHIEDTIFDDGMAVNCIVAANRLIDLMNENQTNNLQSCKNDVRIKRVMWFLNSFVYGQLSKIDMQEEWEKLYREFKSELIDSKK